MPINITGSYKFKRSRKKAPAPLLPGDSLLLKQIEQEAAKKRANKEKDKLEDLGTIKIEWQRDKFPNNLVELVNSILSRMWVDLPENMRDDTKKVVLNGRNIPRIIMKSHLYGIYAHNTTLVDRSIEYAHHTFKVLDVNISGINEMIIEKRLIDSPINNLLEEKPKARWFCEEELRPYDTAELIKQGHITIDSSKPGKYSIAIPRQGAVIRLVLAGRKWLVKTLGATKWKELAESQLEEKLMKSTGYWKDLNGISLEWILYDAVGMGLVDGFDTPMGRGWKLL